MTVTSRARAKAKAAADEAVAEQKAEYATRLRRIQRIVAPALTNAELSAGLELEAPPEGRAGSSDVGRFLSDKKRYARARPDADARGLIDTVLAGDVLLCVQQPSAPGARRAVLICEPNEAVRLDRSWAIVNVAGGPVPIRDFELEDDDVWNMLGGDAPPVAAASPADSAARAAAATARLPRRPPVPAPAGPLRAVAGFPTGPVALGAMRLSTAGRPSEGDAVALIVAALDAGVTLIDTADTYCLDESDRGHNEQLIARALAAWGGRRDAVLVATKAGLRRPDGRWFPDGRPKRLRQACEAALANLGTDAIDLFQLHAPDPRVRFEDSVGELARLREEGKVVHVGLCNVALDQLVEAQTIVPIAAVQNEASFFGKKAFTDGVLAYCLSQGIATLAHRPLGGWSKKEKASTHAALQQVADRHGRTPQEVALAWLLQMSPSVVALVGATRRESLTSSLSAVDLTLTDDDLALLEQRKKWAPDARRELHAAAPVAAPEIVMVMGSPASGKTTSVAPYVAAGYARLNRDTVGGRLDGLLPLMEERIAAGQTRFVLDNTYPDRKSRRGALRLGAEHGIPVTGIRIDIEPRDALVNACRRMLDRHGRLLSPDELKKAGKADPNMFPPQAIHRFFQRYEAPSGSEGFASLTTVPFARRAGPARTGKGLLLDLDGTVRHTLGGPPFPRHPDDVVLLPRRREILARYVEDGWTLVGVTNQAGVALGQVTEEQVVACIERTVELLGLPIDVLHCPHPAGAIRCWCRKPMPGMGVRHLVVHGLDPARSLVVGDRQVDADFAANLGVRFEHADVFFGEDRLP